MLVIGLGTVFVGYTLTYYGLSQIKGGNWGLLDLTIPSRWTPAVALTPRDGQAPVAGTKAPQPVKIGPNVAHGVNNVLDKLRHGISTVGHDAKTVLSDTTGGLL